MRPLMPVLAVGIVLGLAVWAYQQNYATQDALRRIDALNQDISNQRERLDVLRAEWAYLNRPERLRDLAEMNFEPLIGHTYFLYQKSEEKDVLSMIGPKEWGRSMPFQSFLAEVELLPDHTWEIRDSNLD